MPHLSVATRASIGMGLALVILANFAFQQAESATILIRNVDRTEIGFNNLSSRDPVGGNYGTTLGQQRLNVLRYAARLWGKQLRSSVEIIIEAAFEDLPCGPGWAILAGASTAQLFANFHSVPLQDTWYPAAMADTLSGSDLAPGDPDIFVEFNRRIDSDPACHETLDWYYGLNHDSRSRIDFLNVAMHEIAHGLGIQTVTDKISGRFIAGIPGIHDVFVRDLTENLRWSEMTTDAQRKRSAKNSGNVVWDGQHVNAQASSFMDGMGPGGKILLFTPDPIDPMAAISHWDISLRPDALMEPYLGATLKASRGVDLTLCQLQDIGWPLNVQDGCLSTITDSPLILTSQNVIEFHDKLGSHAQPLTLLVSNMGNTPLRIGSVASEDNLDPPFYISSDTCSGNVLDRLSDCKITIGFSPNLEGTFYDSFNIPSNDPDISQESITVTATSISNTTEPPPRNSNGGCALYANEKTSCDLLFIILTLLSSLRIYHLLALKTYASTVSQTSTLGTRRT